MTRRQLFALPLLAPLARAVAAIKPNPARVHVFHWGYRCAGNFGVSTATECSGTRFALMTPRQVAGEIAVHCRRLHATSVTLLMPAETWQRSTGGASVSEQVMLGLLMELRGVPVELCRGLA